jgi:hypothetical protein
MMRYSDFETCLCFAPSFSPTLFCSSGDSFSIPELPLNQVGVCRTKICESAMLLSPDGTTSFAPSILCFVFLCAAFVRVFLLYHSARRAHRPNHEAPLQVVHSIKLSQVFLLCAPYTLQCGRHSNRRTYSPSVGRRRSGRLQNHGTRGHVGAARVSFLILTEDILTG